METHGIFYGQTVSIIISLSIFSISLLLIFFAYKYAVKKLMQKTGKHGKTIDNRYTIKFLKGPLFWFLFWILFMIYCPVSFLSKLSFYDKLLHFNKFVFIIIIGWILVTIIRIISFRIQSRLNIDTQDNLSARSELTKIKIFEGIITVLISIITFAIALMTFDQVRNIGVSLLTSAGIAGIIIGFAAQKSFSAIIAGIQIAMTQPIRLDDLVVVEGESGRIEEITLTYVVVKIWDERRLILPVTYFLEKPFQNWTRNSTEILGIVFLYVDHALPVEPLRKQLMLLLEKHPKWDGRVANIQVTDARENYKELRILVSSYNSSFNWDLRVDIREKMVDYLNAEYPDYFVRTRITGTTAVEE